MIKLSNLFRPKADASILRRLNDEAWQDYNDRLFPPERVSAVGEALADYLEMTNPAEDMAVLSRYHCTREIESVHVSVFNPDAGYWDCHTLVALPRKVTVAVDGAGLFCGGGHPHSIPLALHPYFEDIRQARKAYTAQYRAITQAPHEHKAKTGRYPTWGELLGPFPVVLAWATHPARPGDECT